MLELEMNAGAIFCNKTPYKILLSRPVKHSELNGSATSYSVHSPVTPVDLS